MRSLRPRTSLRRAVAALALAIVLGPGALPAAEAGHGERVEIDELCPVNDVVDVAEPRFTAVTGPSSRVLRRRVRDLTRDFIEGAGRRTGPEVSEPLSVERLMPLPWRGSPARLADSGVLRQRSGSGLEYIAGFLLPAGASWCSPEIDAAPDTRLRFEAANPRDAAASLDVSWRDGSTRTTLSSQSLSPLATLAAARQTDVVLPARRGSVCFEAHAGMAFAGEARILAAEPPSSAAQPRWVVLTVLDDLRADVLEARDSAPSCPELRALARRGRVFEHAISNGCHTYAALLPLLTGRDLTRLSPAAASGAVPEVARSISGALARANLPLSLLAEEVGYHSVFLGNNAFLDVFSFFSRYSGHANPQTGTSDTAQRLGDLVARYADERLFLMQWISAGHAQAAIPRRLVPTEDCAQRPGLARCDCLYAARARHADEALAALERAIETAGRASDSLQIITADHGELSGNDLAAWAKRSAEGKLPGVPHGTTCQPDEVHIPLVLVGPHITPGRARTPVSSLDIAPFLMRAMGAPIVNLVDGDVTALDRASNTPSTRRFVSHGFCVQSTIQDDLQFFSWRADCPNKQYAPRGRGVTSLTELSRRGHPDAAASQTQLRSWLADERRWTTERLQGEALMLDLSQAGRVRLRISTGDGKISDYGPAGPVGGLNHIETVTLSADRKSLDVAFDHYPGRFHVATVPPLARVRIHVLGGGGRPTVFVGPYQLPLDVLDKDIEPRSARTYFVASEAPAPRAGAASAIRLWWQSARTTASRGQAAVLSELNKVLREWGYVR